MANDFGFIPDQDAQSQDNSFGFIPEPSARKPKEASTLQKFGGLLSGIEVGINQAFQTLTGTDLIGSIVGELGEEGDENAFDELNKMAERISPVGKPLGKLVGTAGQIGLGGASRVAGYSAVALNSLSESMKKVDLDQHTPKEVMGQIGRDLFSNLSLTAGLDAALLGVPAALSRIAGPSKKGAVELTKKFSGLQSQLQKGKITPQQAQESAEELLKNMPLVPTVRKLSNKVERVTSQLRDKLGKIYQKADDVVDGQEVVNFSGISDELETAAKEYGRVGQGNVASDLRRISQEVSKELPASQSTLKAWETAKNFAKRGFSKEGDVASEAAVATSRIVKQRIDDALASVIPAGDDIQRQLTNVNAQSTKLLTAARPLSKKATLKTASMLPSTSEIFLFTAGQAFDSPVGGTLAAARFASRAIPNVGTGAAINTLSGLANFGPRIQQAEAARRALAVTPAILKSKTQP